jgi:hypothetical protein
VAYECAHPKVGGFVTLHAASLRDTILRKPDGTQVDLNTRHLKPCSLCQYRGVAKDAPHLVTGIVLTARQTICDACQFRQTCVIPVNGKLSRPETTCPDGRWASEPIKDDTHADLPAGLSA